MSEIHQSVKLAPRILTTTNDTENYTFVGFICPACRGYGCSNEKPNYHGSDKHESAKIECIRCNGSGTLTAKVIIEWMPER